MTTKVESLKKENQNLKLEIASDSHFKESIKKYEQHKKDKAFKLINEKYFEFEGKKDYIFDLITTYKHSRGKDINKLAFDKTENALHLKDQTTEFKGGFKGDFTFFLVFKFVELGYVLSHTNRCIISGKDEKTGKMTSGFDYKVVIDDKELYSGKPDKKIHIAALMNLNSESGNMFVYFDEHLKRTDIQVGKHVFPLGNFVVSGKNCFVYDFIVYNRRMMRDDIKKIINVLAKFHKVPQIIIDSEDRMAKMEDRISDLEKINKKKLKK